MAQHALFADTAGKFFIHIPPLSLLISFVWLHPLESIGKKDLEMLVARISPKHVQAREAALGTGETFRK